MIFYPSCQSVAGRVNISQYPRYVGRNESAFFSPFCARLIEYLLRLLFCTVAPQYSMRCSPIFNYVHDSYRLNLHDHFDEVNKSH